MITKYSWIIPTTILASSPASKAQQLKHLTPFARWLKAEVTEEVKQLKANFNLLESNGWNGENWWFHVDFQS